MKLVTVSQAKSKLSSYIKSAEEGEQVVIMRGSKRPSSCVSYLRRMNSAPFLRFLLMRLA